MHSRFQLARKYFHHYLSASNSKGHGVHSPFVFAFIRDVLRDSTQYACYVNIEHRRKTLQRDQHRIEVEDFGAGSTTIKTKQRIVADIANSSLKPKKYAQLLYRIVRHFKPATVVELGTSFGITTAYLAKGNEAANVYTCEGAASIASIAQQTFDILQLKNVKLVQGDFAATLPALLSNIGLIDLAFIDGNHRKEPTLQYFRDILAVSKSSTIIILDDIHWSTGMEAAWHEVQQQEEVTLTIDLFFIGLVFINPDFKVKQHFSIRF